MMTPGDYATLTEEMEHLGTQDYMGAKSWRGINDDDDENHYPFPLVSLVSLLFLHSWSPILLFRSSAHRSTAFHFSPTSIMYTNANQQVMKPRNRSDSLASAISGTATPSGGRKLSEKDLEKADAALSSMHLNGNGH